MPRQRPLRGERFDISRLADAGEFTYITEPDRGGITSTHTVADMHRLPDYERMRWLLMLRNAGIWFADIATILNFPSASSASAAYVRECRRVGVEPQVRPENRRVHNQIAQMREDMVDNIPLFLNRDHFNGESDDFGFGVEIEQVNLGLTDLTRIVQGLGYACADDNRYGHSGYHEWKAVGDGSLHGGRNGQTGELRSRVLRGYDGFVELRHIMLALKQAGSAVNSSCGQHVHIGIENISQRTQAMVIRAHSMFNDVFDLLLNPSRRNHDHYAAHTPFNTAMWNARCFETGEPYNARCDKYRSLNIGHYQDYGTFEFRSLHGSLNPRHTVSWLQLHFDFISFCEKIARLTASKTDEMLQWDMTNPEVADLWTRMPKTMRTLTSSANATATGIADGVRRYGMSYYQLAQDRDAQVDYMVERAESFCGSEETRRDFPNRLFLHPLLADTGVGLHRQSNDGSRYWRGIGWTERQQIDSQLLTSWSFDTAGSSERRAELRDDNTLNVIAQWAMPIMQEWVSDSSFVGNHTVRKAMREMCKKQFRIDPVDYSTNR